MEHEKDTALLPPPSESTVPTAELPFPDAEKDTEIIAADGEEMSAAAPPKDTPSAAPTEECTTTEGAPNSVQRENGTGGGLLRYAARAGAVLLGGFALLLLAVTVIEGLGHMMSRGFGSIAAEEVFGTLSEPNPPAEEAKPDAPSETVQDLTSLPANEHESSPTETEPSPDEVYISMGAGIPITSADLSAKGERGLSLINETPYEVTMTPESGRAIPPLEELYAMYGENAPVVLILHTHGTESYAADGAVSTTEEAYRSTDPNENILRVGEAMAEVLRSHGINVLHSTEMYDAEDFSMAYYNASLAIREYLAEYPSISYIFDLHRDSIPDGGGGTVRPVTEIDGVDCAQVMFVVGTDHGGADHGDWADNFNLACRIQSRVHEEHEGLMRAINLRSASFNQQYTKGSLLLEMGAVGSSVEEAVGSAKLVGEAVAREILASQ